MAWCDSRDLLFVYLYNGNKPNHTMMSSDAQRSRTRSLRRRAYFRTGNGHFEYLRVDVSRKNNIHSEITTRLLRGKQMLFHNERNISFKFLSRSTKAPSIRVSTRNRISWEQCRWKYTDRYTITTRKVPKEKPMKICDNRISRVKTFLSRNEIGWIRLVT